MVRAVLFDFDGLLLDTEYPEFLSWKEVFDEHGCLLVLETWVRHTGKGAGVNPFSPYDALEEQLGRRIDRDAIRTARRRRFSELMEAETLLIGAEARLNEARRLGLKTAVVSSSPREWIERYLTRFGITDSFDGILCSDDVTHTKPDPELYLAALRIFGLCAEEAIAFEDSAHGIAAAKLADIYCVAVPNRLTQHSNLNEADIVIESLAAMTMEELLLLVGRQGKR